MASLGHPFKFQLVSRLGSVTALHSSSGRQPNFAALNRGRHLYSAGLISRWALAHISSLLLNHQPVTFCQVFTNFHTFPLILNSKSVMSSFRRISNCQTRRCEMSMSEISGNLKRVFLINDRSHGAIRSRCDWIYAIVLLLRPLERWRSIVMCMSVCVCLSVRMFLCPTGYLRNHTRDLYHFFVRVAYVRGSVLIRHVDDRSRSKCNLRLPLLQI